MTDRQDDQSYEQASRTVPADTDETGLNLSVEPGLTDLGDDVYRDVTNSGSHLDGDTNMGLEGGLDPGNTDLGDDVYRDATNQGSVLDGSTNSGLEGDLDPGNTDLGDDVYRTA